MQLEIFAPTINDYRGQCIAAIAHSPLPPSYKIRLVRQLPSNLNYDQYMGVAGLVRSGHHPTDIYRMYNRIFKRFTLFGWLDDLSDVIDRLLS